MVLDKRYKYSYNRNKLANKVSVTVVKIQQKDSQNMLTEVSKDTTIETS